MSTPPSSRPKAHLRVLADGSGWRVCQIVCGAGPGDRPFEEMHIWTSVAIVLDGVFTYRSQRGRALMAPGSVLLGEAGTCFQCGHEHATGDRCVAFQFTPDLAAETLAGMDGPVADQFAAPSLPPLERLLPLSMRARALAAAPDAARAEDLALDVARTAFALDRETAPRAPSAREEAKVAAAVRIIADAYDQPHTIASVAHAVGMGRQRFAVAFRRVVGVTPYNYLLRCRLDAAARRLQDRSQRVLDIALDAGFGDLSEFTRRFTARFGMPPGRYRRLG